VTKRNLLCQVLSRLKQEEERHAINNVLDDLDTQYTFGILKWESDI
jgi:hypothetical protein